MVIVDLRSKKVSVRDLKIGMLRSVKRALIGTELMSLNDTTQNFPLNTSQ